MGHRFPLFRKHVSGKSYYIIHSNTQYKEFQLVGKQILCYDFKIHNYFDTLHLKSLMDADYPYIIAEKQEIESLNAML